MLRSKLAVMAILGGAVLMGCDSKSDDTKAPAPPAIPATPATPAAPATPVAPSATTAPPTPAPAASSDAQAELTQAMQYIKENKFDLANKTLSNLDSMKSSLTPAQQGQLADAHKALDAAKAMGGNQAPQMPAIPK